MKTLRYSVFTVLLPIFLLASCKEARKSIEATLHPKPQKKAEPVADPVIVSEEISSSSSSSYSTTLQQDHKSIFESAAALDSIQQALRNMPHFKGEKLFFLGSFFFYDYNGGIISIDLQDPGKPENIDTYTYSSGEWKMQQPVQLTSNFPLESRLMPLDDVKFSTAKKVYDAGVERSKTIEGAQQINHVYFNYIKEVHVKEWYLMIKSDRRRYQVTFDVNGKFMRMR